MVELLDVLVANFKMVMNQISMFEVGLYIGNCLTL